MYNRRLGKSPPLPLRDAGNVTVTLTLNSPAADDIMGVLKDLANILNIAPPSGYQIVERTTTPPSQKLGLYRTKGKDGKEGGEILKKLFFLLKYKPVQTSLFFVGFKSSAFVIKL